MILPNSAGGGRNVGSINPLITHPNNPLLGAASPRHGPGAYGTLSRRKGGASRSAEGYPAKLNGP